MPKLQSIKTEIDKLDFIEIENICSEKDPVKRMKRQATDEKIFVTRTGI